MIKYIPRLFLQDLRLLGIIDGGSKTVILIVSAMDRVSSPIYLIEIERATHYVKEILPAQVNTDNLDLKTPYLYRLCSSVMSAMVELYGISARISDKPEIVRQYQRTSCIGQRYERINYLQDLLRFQHIQSLTGDNLTTGRREYTISNCSHIRRVIADWHAAVAQTFGQLLPIDRMVRENPENDEAVGRILELFMQNCKKLTFLVDGKLDFNEVHETSAVSYVFAKDKRFSNVMNHVMNPFMNLDLSIGSTLCNSTYQHS